MIKLCPKTTENNQIPSFDKLKPGFKSPIHTDLVENYFVKKERLQKVTGNQIRETKVSALVERMGTESKANSSPLEEVLRKY